MRLDSLNAHERAALKLHDAELTNENAPTAAERSEMSMRRLIPLAAVAARLGVSRATGERMHAAGRLPMPIKLGNRLLRWDAEELEAWLSHRRADGSPLNREEWARVWRKR